MGSPSGKSHDSSDSETSLTRQIGEHSPGARRKIPGETRLDRLVRRPSGERGNPRYQEALPAPALPKALKKPKAKPRTVSTDSKEEPLYDTVANDEPEDEYYDNHLLYGTGSSGKSFGDRSSSTDLGFDEPNGHVKSGSGTLSSTDTEGFSSNPSIQRGLF